MRASRAMPTHLYCLLPPGSAPPAALAGLGDAPVRVLRAGALDAWVSTPPAEGTRMDDTGALVRHARAHDAVVAAALATGETPVPARFGQRFATDEACLADVARRDAALASLLARVRGHVEMTLTARLPDEPDGAPDASAGAHRAGRAGGAGAGAGRAYLERVKAGLAMERNLQLRVAAVRRRVTETVGALVRDEVVQVRPSPSATLSLSHLVARASVSAYRERADVLRADPALPPLVLIGPLAPWRVAEVPHD